jgi:hypothetical protein
MELGQVCYLAAAVVAAVGVFTRTGVLVAAAVSLLSLGHFV